MFKIGQKVVFIGLDPDSMDGLLPPKKDEIVTIFKLYNNGYILKEYPVGLGNSTQWFMNSELRALKPESAIKDLCNDFKEIKETLDVPIKELV